jgi:hypothetical protein
VLVGVFVAVLPSGPPATTDVLHTARTGEIEGLPLRFGEGLGVHDVRRSLAVRTPIPFTLVGFTVPAAAEVALRTSADGSTWTEWVDAEVEDDQRGDLQITEPVWVGEARWLQIRAGGASPAEVTAHLVDSAGLSSSWRQRVADTARTAWQGGPAAAAAAPSQPPIIPRAGWTTDTTPRRAPEYTRTAHAAIIHHTAWAGDMDYGPTEAPAVIRAIHEFHMNRRGWGDIGYNFLVDRFGNVYEGRAGGIDRAVIGAHAQGFNRGTIGVAVLGTFNRVGPTPEALEATAQLLAWQFALHRIDVYGEVQFVSGGSRLYPRGTRVRLPKIFGHRNVGVTECPGDAMMSLLPALRQRVVELAGEFPDLGLTDHTAAVETVVAAGVMNACGPRKFCPDAPVTRGQLATALARATGLDDEPPLEADRFADVASSVHRDAINHLAELGIVKGCDDEGNFCPDDRVSRGQLATFLVRGVDDLKPRWRPRFVDTVGNRHHAAINGLADAGVATGCGSGQFCPNEPVTRAQVATFLIRALQLSRA